MQTVTCEKCQKRHKIDSRLAGKTVKCKVCGHGMAIPALETAETGKLDFAPSPYDAAPSGAAPAKSARSAKPANACPQCSAALSPEAKLCVSCGYNLATGKKLTTSLAREVPATSLAAMGRGSGRASRSGNFLCAADETVLPERCVRCNSRDGVRMIRKTFNHVPFWSVLLTGFVLGYFLFRRTSTITFGLCEHHRRRRTILTGIGFGILAMSAGLFWWGINGEPSNLQAACLLSGAVGFLLSIVFFAIATPTLRAAKIDQGGFAQYRGCGKEFLDTL